MSSRREQAAVLALVAATGSEWYRTAVIIEDAGSALRVVDGSWEAQAPVDLIEAVELGSSVTPAMIDEYEALIEGLAGEGVALLTILDEEYPANLRLVYNRPPFLFVKGQLEAADHRAVAVVGTRQASAEGLAQAQRLATELARADVTVLSGLALGIDTAAHTAALDASGRTMAVMGTGMRTIYPKENAELADRIVESGGARRSADQVLVPDA
jgi:DNA processing protein